MSNAIKNLTRAKLLSLLFVAFSNLLNLAPRGETASRRSLDSLYQKTFEASDSENISKDFTAVGSDLHEAIHAYASAHPTRQTRPRA